MKMKDDQVEKTIQREIKKRGITLYDMLGLPGHGVNPNPEDKITPPADKVRSNRFQSAMGCDRMKELLCTGEYSEWDPNPPLKIPLQDLFRFWWNRCVDKELVVDEILEDIYGYFTDLMRPAQPETPQMDLKLDFHQVPLFEEAANSV
jgi:hypothetical protein